MPLVTSILETGRVPDSVIRFFIRRLLAGRLRELEGSDQAIEAGQQRLADELRRGPIAVATDDANAQHYEVPAAFYLPVLGRHLKYSSGLWPSAGESFDPSGIDSSELKMLELSAERAELADGQDVLELGCGWGSMTLFMAERYPNSRILGVSNSASQRRFILERAAERGLDNVEVLTVDINDLSFDQPERTFDRIVSIEMFEHVRNYQQLFERTASWLNADGKLFVHIFCHQRAAYPFEVRGAGDWMAEHFFTGGMMPSVDFFDRFLGDNLGIEQRWRVSGTHYQQTSEAWLTNMDANENELTPILASIYGADQVTRWRVRWRVFFMACAELFGYRGGDEWLVCHYRFVKP